MRRTLIVLGLVLAVGGLALFATVWLTSGDAPTQVDRSLVPSAVEPVALEPTSDVTPTPEHSVATSASSEPAPVDGANEDRPTLPGVAAVVTIAQYDAATAQVLVGGFVSGVIEDGGTCTFVVTVADSDKSSTFQVAATANVDSTTCGSHSVGAPVAGAGEYYVMMEYSNQSGTVKSPLTPVEG